MFFLGAPFWGRGWKKKNDNDMPYWPSHTPHKNIHMYKRTYVHMWRTKQFPFTNYTSKLNISDQPETQMAEIAL